MLLHIGMFRRNLLDVVCRRQPYLGKGDFFRALLERIFRLWQELWVNHPKDGVHLVRREQALSSYTSEAVAIFLPQSAKQIYRGDLGRNRHEWANRANFSDVLP